MKNIIALLEKFAPIHLAAEWDNVGLIIGDPMEKSSGVVVALDLTHKVIDMAEKTGSNLIIVHHPPIFTPIKKIDTRTPEGGLTASVLKKGISVYAAHTNLDSAPKGLNHHVARMLGLKNIRPVTSGEIIYRIGQLARPADSLEFAAQIKKRLSLKSVRHYGPVKKVKSVALCTGSGGNLLKDAVNNGAELLITGDVRHQEGIESEALGVPMIDAGHGGTERQMIPLVVQYLKKKLTNKGKRPKIYGCDMEENFRNV